MIFKLLKAFARTYMPQPIVSSLKKAQHQYYSRKSFSHKIAQIGELESNIRFLKSNEDLVSLLNKTELLRDRRIDDYLVEHVPFIRDFFRDVESYKKFCKEIEGKRCLEVGSGPIGLLPLLPWIKERVIIDPLLDSYRVFQLKHFGKTFFTDDIKSYSQEAEKYIQSLDQSINGFIISRNTLDHCESPEIVLENISRYAAPGCKLLLWTDLWHLKDIDEKHRNITRDKDVFEKKLINLGFKIDSSFSDVRDDNSTIEYGCIATKL